MRKYYVERQLPNNYWTLVGFSVDKKIAQRWLEKELAEGYTARMTERFVTVG